MDGETLLFLRQFMVINIRSGIDSRLLLMTLCLSFLSTLSFGQKPIDYTEREIINEKTEESITNKNVRISLKTGYPLNIRDISYKVEEGSPESMARQYLIDHLDQMGLTVENITNDLSVSQVRNGLSGYVIRLNQTYRGIPVYQGQITIHINQQHTITYLANSWKYEVENILLTPQFQIDLAFEKAVAQVKIELPTTYQDVKTIIYQGSGVARLAYRHHLSGQDHTGEWEVITDAINGDILKAKNTSFNCKSHHDHQENEDNISNPIPFMVNGNGNVFDPDPLSSAMVNYGDPGFSDANDANTAALEAELANVILPDLTLNMGMHELKGPYAEIVDFEAPFNGLFTQASSTFNFNRNDNGFEAVNVYYHIDASMRYLNETLGLNISPYQYPGGVQADPSGQNGADNSQYQGGLGRLTFGEGGVDDAEDSDVIHHELGHGLHDWVTNGSLSQVNGLSEGSGDYWAASYNRSLGNWTPADPQHSWVFNWDGHNQFWQGRSVDYRPASPAYPTGLIGQVHTDGQIWATCMMDVWDVLGKSKTDAIFWEGLSMTNSASNQDDAANAVYQAALDMSFSSSDLVSIYTALSACGYDLPLPPRDCTGVSYNLTGELSTDHEYIASSTIISDQQITSDATVLFHAGTTHTLNSPFSVESGSLLTLISKECIEP